MRKFFFVIFAMFYTAVAWGAPVAASFSVQCSYPGSIDCKILGTQNDIITINTCDEFKKYNGKTPGGGKALLLRLNDNDDLSKCLQITISFNTKKCERKILYIRDSVSQQTADILLSCAKETSYNTTYISGNDYRKGNLLNVSYDTQKCITSGGTPTKDGGCSCAKDEEDIDGQCFCKYGSIKFPKTGNSCPDAYLTTCMATGGTNKTPFDPTTDCICPKDKHLVQATDKGSCVCDIGYIFQDPSDRQLGCVEQDKTLNINVTVTDVKNHALSNVTATYNTKDGTTKTATTNANGILSISNVPNTAYIKITKNDYAPTIYSAVNLSTENKVTLYKKSNNTYQACLPQDQNSTRSNAGLQIDSNQYVYCGNANGRDCDTNDMVKGADNRLYKCTNNSWVYVDTSNADKCGDHVLKYAHEPIEFQNDSVVLITNHFQRELPDGSSYQSAAVTSYCQINDLQTYCENHESRIQNNVCNNPTGTPTHLDDTAQAQGEETPNPTGDNATTTTQAETNDTYATGTESEKTIDKELAEKLKSARDELAAAKEKENSWANRGLSAASTAMTGLGGMQLAQGIAEKKADADAEKEMRAYIETMKCDYGGGKNITMGNEEITLPGGNELLEYYTEYKTLADNLKTTKAALGLRSGIESEVLYDRAQSGLYQYAPTGKTGGAEISLYRALTDSDSEDAARWAEQKDASDKKLKTGAIVAGAGIATGIVGNYLINGRNKIKTELNEKTEIVKKNFPLMIVTPLPQYSLNLTRQNNYRGLGLTSHQPEETAPINAEQVSIASLNLGSDQKLFASGKYNLDENNTAVLDDYAKNTISDTLHKEEYKDVKIIISCVGHTDRVQPSKTNAKTKGYSTNEELSDLRAKAVCKYLEDKLSDLKDRIEYSPSGLGDKECDKETYQNDQEEKCRRVDITPEIKN